MPNTRAEKKKDGFPPATTSMPLTPATRDLLFALKDRFGVSSLSAVVEKLAKDAAEKAEVLFTPKEMFALKLNHQQAKETPSDMVRRLLRTAGAFDAMNEAAPKTEADL